MNRRKAIVSLGLLLLGGKAAVAAFILPTRTRATQDPKGAATDSLIGKFQTSDRGAFDRDSFVALSVHEQSGQVVIRFFAFRPSGRGAAPEGSGIGSFTSDGSVQFSFEDSFGNRGNGIFRRRGRNYQLTIDISEVANGRCFRFFGDQFLDRVTA